MADEADIRRDDKRSWAKKPRNIIAIFFLLQLFLVGFPLLLYQLSEPAPAIKGRRMESNPQRLSSDLNEINVPDVASRARHARRSPPSSSANSRVHNASAHETRRGSNPANNK